MATVLIADDERKIRKSLQTTLMLEGYEVETVSDGEQALALVERGGVDLLLLDWQMPNRDGLSTLQELRRRGHEVPVVFLSAHGTIERAVEAVRDGAFDFIEKPPLAERLLLSVKNGLRQSRLVEENRSLRSESQARYDMVGESAVMRALYDQIRLTAPTQARVLILGENGTGKELIARALHEHSLRRDEPFVRVNCAAVPRELFESELFGHEKGAFTGATSRRRGKFVRADGGTLFLDEVGEIPLELQAKLLRALESGEIEPVGSEREVRVDTRVLAATNRNLEQAIEDGQFRRDLYYRLQVVTLTAPPLRERLNDVAALSQAFLRQVLNDNNLPVRDLTPAALEQLARHHYPGNVRELKNLIERLVILTPGEEIGADDVAKQLGLAYGAAPSSQPVTLEGSLRETVAHVERDLIVAALEERNWNMSETASQLGLERSHLYKKLKALGIEKPS
jgi:two-component system nitrogen regulation response regulator NtrX